MTTIAAAGRYLDNTRDGRDDLTVGTRTIETTRNDIVLTIKPTTTVVTISEL